MRGSLARRFADISSYAIDPAPSPMPVPGSPRRPGPHHRPRPQRCHRRRQPGTACRHDHRLKHVGGWQLSQPQAGHFIWLSPLGRRYHTQPPPITQDLPDPQPGPTYPACAPLATVEGLPICNARHPPNHYHASRSTPTKHHRSRCAGKVACAPGRRSCLLGPTGRLPGRCPAVPRRVAGDHAAQPQSLAKLVRTS